MRNARSQPNEIVQAPQKPRSEILRQDLYAVVAVAMVIEFDDTCQGATLPDIFDIACSMFMGTFGRLSPKDS